MKQKNKSWLQIRKEEDEKEDRIKIITFSTFFLSSAVHLILILTIVVHSLVPTIPLVIVYIGGTAVCSYILKKKQISYYGWKAYALFPLIINTVFTINYFFSWPVAAETHRFRTTTEEVIEGRRGTKTQMTTGIILENDCYQNYLGMRVFGNVEKLYFKCKVTYFFNRGIFGIRVVKKYKFE